MSFRLPTFSPAAPLAAALLLAACQAKTETAPRAERPVQVQRVRYESPATVRDFVGVVRARHESDLGFRVGGKVVARFANVGDKVRAGQVLAELDSEVSAPLESSGLAVEEKVGFYRLRYRLYERLRL